MQNQTSSKKHRVIIVGGGFGGIKTALDLTDSEDVDITLISDGDNFHYHASLYRAATGGSKVQTLIPLSEIFADTSVKLIKARASKLNRKSKTLSTINGQHYPYDTLVLALGSVTNYFGIRGLEKNSYGIKNYEQAAALNKHLHAQLIADHKPDFNYVVIGAGPSGVELAGVLPGYVKKIMKQHRLPGRTVHISLVEAAGRILPSFSRDVSWSVARRLRRLGVHILTNKTVRGASSNDLIIEGKSIKSNTIIWTAGITNHPFFTENNFLLDKTNRVKVNEYLEAEPDIFVLGDNASTKYSGMAQTAIRDGDLAAKNIKCRIKNELLHAYKPKRPFYITPVGRRWAVVVYGKWRLYGRLGWMIRRLADWMAYREVEPWWKATRQWLAANDLAEDCSYCAVNNKS